MNEVVHYDLSLLKPGVVFRLPKTSNQYHQDEVEFISWVGTEEMTIKIIKQRTMTYPEGVIVTIGRPKNRQSIIGFVILKSPMSVKIKRTSRRSYVP